MSEKELEAEIVRLRARIAEIQILVRAALTTERLQAMQTRAADEIVRLRARISEIQIKARAALTTTEGR